MDAEGNSSDSATAKQRRTTKPLTSGSKASTQPVNSAPPTSSIASIVAGDVSLLLAASGICTLTLSGLLSLAVVVLDDNVTSVTQLRLFSPSMVTGSVLLTIGMLNGMLRYSNRKAKAAPGEIVLPPGHPPISPNSEMVELDETGSPKKRVSRCPMGF